MPESVNRLGKRSDQFLLQLWRGRDGLKDEDVDVLRDELDKRGLSKELEEIVDQGTTGSVYGELSPGPWTYGNLSVPFWWLRELWLQRKTRNGISIEATITLARRTAYRRKSAARAELIYSYEFQGKQYDGRVVRDFALGPAAADSLAYDHHPGEQLPIVICQNDPKISYYPSGFGFIEPMCTGTIYVAVIAFVLFALLGTLHGH